MKTLRSLRGMKSAFNSLSSLANYKGALSLLVFLLYIGVSTAWGTTLFHETFGDNSGSARAWNDSYSVKSGISDVYSGASYTITNTKQSKNTKGSTASGLVSGQAQIGTFIVGPLNVSNYSSLTLSNYFGMSSASWSASSFMRCSFSTNGLSYTLLTRSDSNTPSGAVGTNSNFVQATYTVPVEAQSSTLYLKFEFYCYQVNKNSEEIGQAYFDEVELAGTGGAVSCTTNPTVTASSNSSVGTFTATVTCSTGLSSLGSAGCSISSYGFVVGTSSNPAIGGSGVTQHEVGTSYTVTGTSFYKDLTGLTPSTTYYVRPYATNGNGTGYGTQTSFTTSVAVYNTYSLATSSTVFGDGDEIIITNSAPNRALSTTQNASNRGETTVTPNGSGKILVADGGPVQVITLEKSEDNWMFNVGTDAYLRAASNSSNDLNTATKEVAGDNGVWSISINESDIATLVAQGNYSRHCLQYNSSSHLFSCYADGNSMQAVKIYYSSDPRIHVSPVPLETFTYAVGDGPSQTQALTIKGFNLTGNLTVTCPTGYEISTTSMYSGFGTSSITLTKDANGKVNTIVFIRLSSGKSAGSYNQTMSISGGGITTESISLCGTVSAVPGGTPTLYTLVQTESDIFPDDEIIVMTAKGDNILGNSPTDKSYRAVVSTGFTILGRTVYVTSSDIQNILLEGTEDEWKFNVDVPNSKYLYSGTSSNELKTNTWTYAATNGKWNISIGDATSIATVKSNLTETSSSNRNWLLYNYNSGNTPAARFNCYGSVQSDFIKLYAKPSATPNVCGSPLELTGFEMTYGEGASAAQSFKVKGRNLTSNITVTAPTGYEVCETESGTYTASLTLTPSDGKVTPTTLWVRLKADNEAADDVSGNITIAATGATTRNIAVTGTVNPNPVITLVATSDPLLVTSRNGVNIMATNTLTLNIRGARAGQPVSISGTGLKFYQNNGTKYVDLSSSALTAPVTNQVVYVSYNPTTTGTGAIETPSITVSCDGGSETFSNKIKVRNLPDAVAIVANVNGVWQALPANMTSAQNPEAVTVTVKTEGGILKAYGPSTIAYKLWPVRTVNSEYDRWGNATGYTPAKLYGNRLRFAGNSNAGLWANNSTSANTIRNWASITEVGSDATEAYEWIVTTTESDGQFVYNLQTAHGDNNYYLRYWPAASGGPKWGTYNNGIQSLYILPLTEVTEAAISVMEWGTNKIAVSYPSGGSCTAMTASINNASPTTVTMTSRGGDIYELTGVGDLQGNPSKTLVLTATEGGTKQAIIPIPYIISDEVAEATIRTAVGDAARLTDVIICNGGKLTTGTAEGHFKDLYIYPGGKAKITNNFAATNIYIRGGYSFLDNKATYRYPDLCIVSGTVNTASVKYDMYIDNSFYYTFSMPYDVALADVHDETGSDAFKVWVKHYNGAARASGQHVSGWEWYGDEVGQSSFFAGVGYEITAKPRVSGRPIAIIRFPVKTGNLTTDAERTVGVEVGNYGYSDYTSGSLAANNVGWNFVGNPYLTEFKAVNDTSYIVAQDYKQHIDPTTGIWDGTYEWSAVSKQARFITIPYDTQTDYHAEYVHDYAIPAFSAFFIQTEYSGTFTIGGNHPQAAVAPRFGSAPKEKPELHVDVLLSGEGEAVDGKAGLFIHDKYEGGLKDFEDVEQWFVEQNELKTYMFADGVALSYNLTNEQAAKQTVPMGYIATVAGEHTYSINEANDVSALEHLWLTDNETGITTDLLARDYVFTTAAGRFDERFALSAVFKQEEVITDVGDVGDSDWIKAIGVYHEGNILTLRGLPENSAVYVYDMTGKLIASGNKLHNVMSFSIAAQGVYNIRVVNNEQAVTLRSVSR